MRRVRQLPIESVVAIAVLAAALLSGAGVLVSASVRAEPDRSVTRSVGSGRDVPSSVAPPTTSAGRVAAPPTTRPAGPGAPATTTTTTTTPGAPTTTAAAGEAAGPAACTELVSETRWAATGDRSALETAAGGSADYVEVVTNRGEGPCRLLVDECAPTTLLRRADGSPTERPPRPCAEAITEVMLAPGQERRQETTLTFPVPPGAYRLEIARQDGTTAELPVVLDDRLAACDPDALSIGVDGGDVFRRLDEVLDTGLDIDLVVTGPDEPCTVRVEQSRIELTREDERVDLVDDTERWSALDPGEEVRTHAVGVVPTDLAEGGHEGVVTLVLDDGAELAVPFRLLLG